METDAVSTFVRDAIAALDALGARDETEYLRIMLEYDGPDVDGAVSSLVKYGAVTVAWLIGLQRSTMQRTGSLMRSSQNYARASPQPRHQQRNPTPSPISPRTERGAGLCYARIRKGSGSHALRNGRKTPKYPSYRSDQATSNSRK